MYDVKRDTITIDDTTYDVVRSTDHATGADRLTIEREGSEVEGITGTLGYDDHGHEYANPRDWSNVGRMAVNYRGYELGDTDETLDDSTFIVTCAACEGNGTVEVEGPQTERDAAHWRGIVDYPCAACDGAGEVFLDPAEYFRRERGARVVIGLFVYEHSGITISAGETIAAKVAPTDVRSTDRFVGDSAGWDTSFVGFTFDTPESVRECIGENATDEQIEAALRGEVSTYASYLEGDVTYYSVADDETDYHESCGGFVAASDDCEIECFSALEGAIETRNRENAERAYWASRDVETIAA